MCRGKGTVCVVNNGFQMAPWADVLYAADAPWWQEYFLDLRSFQGRRVTISPGAVRWGAREVYPACTDSQPGRGLGRDKIHRCGNSGYQAINLAFLNGARTIVLLGFDMAHTFGRRHWHADHPAPLGNADGVESWLPKFPALAADLSSEGVSVINCSSYSRLECFPRMRLRAYLEC